MSLLSLILAATALPGQWEIHEAERFCYLWRGPAEPGGAELGLALDVKDKAKIILSNSAWQLQPDRSYPLTAGIDGSVKPRKARGLKLGSDWVALVAEIDEPSFVDRLAGSSQLSFQVARVRAGPAQGNFALAEAGAAARALKSCQAALKIKVRDRDKQTVERETVFRTDSQGEHGTDAGLKNE